MQPIHQLPWAQPNGRVKTLTFAILPLWLLLALGGSLLGVFDSEQHPPIPLGAAAILPVLAYAICYLTWAEFRQFVLAANLRVLTLAQTWRIGGVVFLILHSQGLLPGVFALPAGWGDIAIGATAPLVAWAISSKKSFPKEVFVGWNVLGTLDLVMAVTLGILASASPLGILAGEVTTAVMGRFPLSLIPTFFVPLLIIFHLIALAQVSNKAVHRERNGKKEKLMKENLEKVKLLARDLRNGKEFPRSPRDTLAGYVLAARAVDKCRAVLVDWQGDYHSNCPLDQRWLKFAEIDYKAFRSFVATGATDDEIAAWIGEHAKKRPRADIVIWNNRERDLRLSDLSPELQEYMEDYIASNIPRGRVVYRYFDIYDLEEKRL